MSDEETEPESFSRSYFTVSSATVQSDGGIIVPMHGFGAEGIWDGMLQMPPEHEDHAFWVWLLQRWPYESDLSSGDLPLLKAERARALACSLLVKLEAAEPLAQKVHLHVIAEIITTPDDMALRCGLKPIGTSAWISLDRPQAMAALQHLLRCDMAHSQPRLPVETAQMVAAEFLGHFSPAARFFTNGGWHEEARRSLHSSTVSGPGWQPATGATFDGGVVVLDTTLAGLLWLEDED